MVRSNEHADYFTKLTKTLRVCTVHRLAYKQRCSHFKSDRKVITVSCVFLQWNCTLFTLITMPPKRKSNASDGDSFKQRKTITLEVKGDIIKRSEIGESDVKLN